MLRKISPAFTITFIVIVVFGLVRILIISSNPIAGQKNSLPDNGSNIPTDTNVIKLSISNEGIYQVKLDKLGWENINPNSLLLTHRGQPQSIWYKQEENSVFFYGQSSDSVYTNENIYILEISEKSFHPLADATTFQSSDHFTEQVITSIRLEENQYYAPLVKTGDHWLWQKIIAPNTQTIEVELTDLVPGEGNIQIGLWGNTTSFMVHPDHHVIVIINGTIVSDSTWDGQIRQTIDIPIPYGVLRQGKNTIEIKLPGDTESLIEIVYLDWIKINYPIMADLSDDTLFFETGSNIVRFTNFGDEASIIDITYPQSVTISTIAKDLTEFRGKAEHRYIAVTPKGYLIPDRLSSLTKEPELLASSQGAEYVVIGPEDFLIPMEPLLEWRNSQGLSVVGIPIAAIYDQFNYGLSEPEAIQHFLAYTAQNWNPAPKYVLLVGDTTYDFKGYTVSAESNILPAMMVYTSYGGETVSDVLLAQINDDPWPDVAIGRIPAQTQEQVTFFVDKVLYYEQKPYDSSWHQNILAVADGFEPIFQKDAQYFIDLFPTDYQSTLFSPPSGAESASEDFLDLLQKGSFITAYFGHGSINMWGKDRIFSTDDVENISNKDYLPVMLQLTCLTGLFTHPTEESLAEKLIWNTEGGAVAIIASTSLTQSGEQAILTEAFVEELLRAPNSRLGDILLYAWRQIPTDNQSSLDVLNTFLLFGDPALQLPTPP